LNYRGLHNRGGVYIEATVDCEGKTGVEMEAMMAASVAGLTMYDMLKGVDKAMTLTEARVLKKSGGKSGDWSYNYKSRGIVKASDTREGRSEKDVSQNFKPLIERQRQEEKNQCIPNNDHAISPTLPTANTITTDMNHNVNHNNDHTTASPTPTPTQSPSSPPSQAPEPPQPPSPPSPTREQIIQERVLTRQHEIDHGRLVPAESITPSADVQTILAEASKQLSPEHGDDDATYQRALAVVKRGYVTANDLRNARIREWLKRNLENGLEIPLGPAR